MRKCVLGWTVTPEVLDSWASEGQTGCRLPQSEGTLRATLRPATGRTIFLQPLPHSLPVSVAQENKPSRRQGELAAPNEDEGRPRAASDKGEDGTDGEQRAWPRPWGTARGKHCKLHRENETRKLLCKTQLVFTTARWVAVIRPFRR